LSSTTSRSTTRQGVSGRRSARKRAIFLFISGREAPADGRSRVGAREPATAGSAVAPRTGKRVLPSDQRDVAALAFAAAAKGVRRVKGDGNGLAAIVVQHRVIPLVDRPRSRISQKRRLTSLHNHRGP